METYSKLLVSKHSPKNGCHVPEGEVLTVLPRKNLAPNKDTGHYFVSALDESTKSKFGWVTEASPFSLDGFIENYLGGKKVSDEEREHIRIMLSSVARLPPDTPVASNYFVRGIIERKVDFAVHKVVFYHPKE